MNMLGDVIFLGIILLLMLVVIIKDVAKYHYDEGMKSGMKIQEGLQKGLRIEDLNKIHDRYKRIK